jgi:hypothetical protein
MTDEEIFEEILFYMDTRIKNFFIWHKIDSLELLLQKDWNFFIYGQGFGKKSLQRLRDVLSRFKLDLKE